MQYIRQPDPLAALPGTIFSAFAEGMKDAQVRQAFEAHLVEKGIEKAPDDINPEEAVKQGYKKTAYGWLRPPEFEIREVPAGALNEGSPAGWC